MPEMRPAPLYLCQPAKKAQTTILQSNTAISRFYSAHTRVMTGYTMSIEWLIVLTTPTTVTSVCGAKIMSLLRRS